ncbi:heme ABC transporter permease/ATP-binding protein CydD [Pseudaeromonas paramecii]|uniref:Cysteine/glutathione ABC transporter permease/ATP-binding protein CydD n=1 Tax=Pseudaeromonas paramecii TaxID=2138166 RepID=A0ABP8Q4T7_9GAMM
MDKSRQRTLTGWLRQGSRLARPWLGITLLLGTLSALVIIAQAYLLARLLHGIIIDQQDRHSLLMGITGLLLLALLRGLLAWAKEQSAFRGAARVRQGVRRQVLDALQARGPAYLQQKPAGSWASLLLEQVEELHDFYARYQPQAMLAVLQPLLILLVVFPVNWAAGLILLATAPLIPFFMILTGIGAADANRRNFQALSRLSAHFLDRLKGLATLRRYHRAQAEGAAITAASEDFRERTMEVLRMAFLSSAVLEFFASVSIAVVAVYFGFSYLEHLNFGDYGRGVTLFAGLFVLLLAPDFFLPLRELGSHYHAKAQAIGGADQLEAFLAQPLLQLQQGDSPFLADGPVSIEARDLEVLSADGQRLLGPLSFSLPAGCRTALIGRTGAGKSSLIQALLGFAPYRGSLKVNGQELASLEMTSWRRHLAWLRQNPRLIHGSLRDNLCLGLDAVDEAARLDALRQAGALALQQDKGWDYPIGEQAAGLSVGQAQRLALARTLLHSAQHPAGLWLLDEPTASLDRHTEQQIMDALAPRLAGPTSLMVSHRPEQLQQAERWLLIEAGQLVADGSPAELATHPAYQRLVIHHNAQEPRP